MHSPAWHEQWSDLYDAMDLDRSLHRGFYGSLVTPATRNVLDLGCGTGSITAVLQAALPPGGRVTGVDLSPRMVEIARARLPGCEWLLRDISAPPVSGQFDLIVICFHTLQLLTDPAQVQSCFDAVSGLLSPNGRFAFDIYQPNLDYLRTCDPGPLLVRRFKDRTGLQIDVIETENAFDEDNLIISGRWDMHETATGKRIDGLPPLYQSLRQYFPADIEAALSKAGMRMLERYGELDRSPFVPTSKRQIYVCGRA